MAENQRPTSFEDLPYHIILEMLVSGGLSVTDLVNLELTSKVFVLKNEDSSEFKSVADHAASRLCSLDPIFVSLSSNHREELLDRCKSNWKRVLRFLRSCDRAETSKDKVQITTGYNYTIINNSKMYRCGTNKHGDFTQGPLDFPFSSQVMQVSARNNNIAFVMQSGEVFTCGRTEFGQLDTNHPMYKPKRVEALKRTPCKQVAVGIDFTVFLSREGHVYTVRRNRFGQLGHGDTINRKLPKLVKILKKIGPIVQISAGPYYVLALTEDGSVYSFGDGADCLGDGSFKRKLQPHVIQTFKIKGIHVLNVSAGDEHAAAVDSNGYVYTWGKRYPSVIGFDEPVKMATPEFWLDLENYLVVQVCADNMKTFVVTESSSLMYRIQ